MCNQGDTVGSTWVLNFQPKRRRYVTRRRQTTSVRLHYAYGPGRNRFGCMLLQATPRPLAETLRRKMIHRMVIYRLLKICSYQFAVSVKCPPSCHARDVDLQGLLSCMEESHVPAQPIFTSQALKLSLR